MKSVLLYISLTFLVIHGSELYGQEYRISQLTVENGLPSNFIDGFYQDSLGVVYAATRAGLAKIYGDKIKVINAPLELNFGFSSAYLTSDGIAWMEYILRHDKVIARESKGLNGSLVICGKDTVRRRGGNLANLDWKGNLWSYCGSKRSGDKVSPSCGNELIKEGLRSTVSLAPQLDSLGLLMNNIQRVPEGAYSKNKLNDFQQIVPFEAIPNIIIDNRGHAWIRSLMDSLYVYDYGVDSFIRTGLSIKQPKQIIVETSGQVWAVTISDTSFSQRLNRFDAVGYSSYPFSGNITVVLSPSEEVYVMDDTGLFKFDGKTFKSFYQSSGIKKIIFDQKSIPIALVKKDEAFKIVRLSASFEAEILSLPSNSWTYPELFIDKDNILWVGSNQGIYKCVPKQVSSHSLVHRRPKRSNYRGAYPELLSHGIDSTGKMYFREYEYLYSEYEGKVDTIYNFKERSPHYPYWSKDEKGNLYVCDFDNIENDNEHLATFAGIIRFDSNYQKKDITSGELSAYVGTNRLGRVVLRFYKNQLYLFTSVGTFVLRDNEFKLYAFNSFGQPYNEVLPCSDMVTSGFYICRSNTRVGGGRDKPLNISNLAYIGFDLNKLEYFNLNFLSDYFDNIGRAKGLNLSFKDFSETAACLFPFTGDTMIVFDRNGIIQNYKFHECEKGFFSRGPIVANELVFVLVTQGLVILNLATGNHKHLGAEDGLLLDYNASMYKQPNSEIVWISSYGNLYRIDALGIDSRLCDRVSFQTLTRSDGFCSGLYHEFIGDSILRVYNTQEFSDVRLNVADYARNQRIGIHFTSVKLFGEHVDWSHFKCSIDSVYGDAIPNNLKLPYYQNQISFEFQAVSNSSYGPIKYEYKLRGDRNETYESQSNIASFHNLSPGDYTFTVLSIDSHGNTSEPIEIKFTIARPFWLTWWFWTGFVALILLLIWRFIKFREIKSKEEKKTLERMVEEKTKQLKESFRQRSDDAGHLTHEYKDATATISLYLAELEDASRPEGRYTKIIRSMRGILGNMTVLTESFKRVADLDGGGYEPVVSIVNLRDKLTRLINVCREHPALSNGTFIERFPNHALVLEMPWESLSMVLRNLLANAVEHNINKKVEVSISFEFTEAEPQMLTVVVKDNGAGIPAEKRAVIFEQPKPGERRRSKTGWGMGLYYCRQALKKSGGSIQLIEASAPNEGAEFRVTLPVIVKTGLVINNIESVKGSSEDFGFTSKIHIVIAEDGLELREQLGRVMERAGASVQLFDDGAEAFKYCQSHGDEIDLVLTDVEMPGMRGFELCQEIKKSENTRHLSVVIYSALSEQVLQNRGLDSGADGYIMKEETEPRILVQQLKNLLQTINASNAKAVRVGIMHKTREELLSESIKKAIWSILNKTRNGYTVDKGKDKITKEILAQELGLKGGVKELDALVKPLRKNFMDIKYQAIMDIWTDFILERKNDAVAKAPNVDDCAHFLCQDPSTLERNNELKSRGLTPKEFIEKVWTS